MKYSATATISGVTDYRTVMIPTFMSASTVVHIVMYIRFYARKYRMQNRMTPKVFIFLIFPSFIKLRSTFQLPFCFIRFLIDLMIKNVPLKSNAPNARYKAVKGPAVFVTSVTKLVLIIHPNVAAIDNGSQSLVLN